MQSRCCLLVVLKYFPEDYSHQGRNHMRFFVSNFVYSQKIRFTCTWSGLRRIKFQCDGVRMQARIKTLWVLPQKFVFLGIRNFFVFEESVPRNLVLLIKSRQENQSFSLDCLIRSLKCRKSSDSQRILISLLENKYIRASDVYNKLMDFYMGKKRANNAIFDILINVCCKLKKKTDAIDVFYLMVNSGFNPAIQSCNNLLDLLVKSDFPNLALKVFEEMLNRGISADIYSYKMAIHAYCKLGSENEARSVLNSMKDKGVVPNASVYDVLIYFFCKNYHMEKAEQLLVEMESEKVSIDSTTVSMLMNAYIRDRNYQKIHELFVLMLDKRIEPSQTIYRAVIDGLCKQGNVIKVMQRLKDMRSKGLLQNIYIHNTFISGIGEIGHMDFGLKLLKDMANEGYKPDLVNYSSLIKKFCEKKMTREALKLLDKLLDEGLLADFIIYNSIIDGYCKAGKEGYLNKAIILGNKMMNWGSSFDAVSYNILISQACHEGNMQVTGTIFCKMIKNAIFPNFMTYAVMVEAYCKDGDADSSLRILELMKEHDLIPSTHEFKQLILRLCMDGNINGIIALLSEVHEGKLNTYTTLYDSVMDKLCNSGNMTEAFLLCDEFLKNGFALNSNTCNSIMSGFFRLKKLRKALKVFQQMCEYNITPCHVTYRILSHYIKDPMLRPKMLEFFCKLLKEVLIAEGFIEIRENCQVLLLSGLILDRDISGACNVLCENSAINSELFPNLLRKITHKLLLENKAFELTTLYCRLWSKGTLPDVNSTRFLLRFLCNLGNIQEAKLIMNNVIEKGMKLNLGLENINIGNQFNRESISFNELLREESESHILAFVYLVKDLMVHGNIEQGTMFLTEFLGKFPTPIIDYRDIIGFLLEKNRLDHAMSLFSEIEKKGIHSNFCIHGMLIKKLCQFGRFDEAEMIFEKLLESDKDLYLQSYSLLLRRCFKKNLRERAMKFCNKMIAKGTAPSLSFLDVRTCNSLIREFCRRGNLKEASMLCDEILKEGYFEDISTLTVLIQSLCDKSKIKEAKTFLNRLIENDQKPDLEAFNIIISSLCKLGYFESCIELIEKSSELNLFPDFVICTGLLCSLCRNGNMEISCKLWNLMLNNGFPGDEVTFGSMILGYSEEGNIQKALYLLLQMHQRGFSCNRYLLRLLICKIQGRNHLKQKEMLIGSSFKRFFLSDEQMHKWLPNDLFNRLDHRDEVGDRVSFFHIERYDEKFGISPELNIVGHGIIQGPCFTLSDQKCSKEAKFSLMEALEKQFEESSHGFILSGRKNGDDDENKVMKLRKELLERGII